MQVNNSLNPTQNTHSVSKPTASSLSASSFLNSLSEDIAAIFESLSDGLDEDIKLKRAMSLSLHMSNPIFMSFDGNYPEKMPADVKYAMQQQSAAYKALDNETDKNIFMLDWMINSIGHEQSSDPGFKDFLKSMREEYSGVASSDYKTRDQANEDDYSLQKFKDDLKTKGALKFLLDFNQEKIEKMVEEYKDKLLKEMEENPDLDLDIEQMVNDYRKMLLERLAELEKEKKSTLNIHKLESDMSSKQNVKLEDILMNL